MLGVFSSSPTGDPWASGRNSPIGGPRASGTPAGGPRASGSGTPSPKMLGVFSSSPTGGPWDSGSSSPTGGPRASGTPTGGPRASGSGTPSPKMLGVFSSSPTGGPWASGSGTPSLNNGNAVSIQVGSQANACSHSNESALQPSWVEESATVDEGYRPWREWPTIEGSIFNRVQSFLSTINMDTKWKRAFLASCVLGVLIDPLFFYIPVVNMDTKCIGLGNSLKEAIISLRSTTDLFYVVNIVIQIYTKLKANRIWRILSHILIDILAVLPIPQAVIFIFMDSSSLNTRMFLAFLALLQYVPRVLRIYLLCTKLNDTLTRDTKIWIIFKGAFSFFLVILASHEFGAFWYFLAIQRETACWQNACRNNNECEPTTFYCNGRTIGNITFLDDLCSINPHNTNATPFDFGIFVEAVRSGVLESTNIPKKFFHCFWWGLRNLSSLGQNLETSNYTWENIFAIFISLSGLLLFLLYLLTNLKICMKLVTGASSQDENSTAAENERSRGITLGI